MLIKKAADLRSSEITDEKLFVNRREFLRTAGVAAAGAGLVGVARPAFAAGQPAPRGRKLDNVQKSPLSLRSDQERPNSWDQITTYNNYYEFGTDKEQPSLTSGKLKTEPWSIVIDGECAKK